MNATNPSPRLVLARLPVSEPTEFRIVPGADAVAALARDLDLLDLRKVRFEGRLIPEGRDDWRLEAKLGATVVQPCSVTLVPVTTRIDAPVQRRYRADYAPPTEAEAEMPEDDSLEPLPEAVDLAAVMAEALALALPDFPRAEGAELGESVFTEPGADALTDETAKPFAGLEALKKSMEN